MDSTAYPRYDVVILDADDTLFDFAAAERLAFAQVAARYGLAAEALFPRYRAMNLGLWKRLERGEITKEALLRTRFARFFAEDGALGREISAEESAACNQVFLDALSGCSQLVEGAEDLCRALAGPCRLYLATNGVARVQARRLNRSAIAPYISGLFVSEEVGHEKPSPAFFEAVFRALGHPAKHRCIMLGDSLSSDMAGARGAGIACCWYCPAGAGAGEADYRIRRLHEFIPIVLGVEAR